jgi:type IV pilus biogenesis protein CpaD/CtpE
MTRRILLGLALCALAACTEHEPYHQEGQWQPEGVNAGNMAAMAADPLDFIRGRGTTTPERHAADAVTRLWNAPTAAPAAGAAAAGTAQSASPPSSKPAGS